MREIVNGLMYVLSTGCQWRAIPKDLPPKSTVYDYFHHQLAIQNSAQNNNRAVSISVASICLRRDGGGLPLSRISTVLDSQ